MNAYSILSIVSVILALGSMLFVFFAGFFLARRAAGGPIAKIITFASIGFGLTLIFMVASISFARHSGPVNGSSASALADMEEHATALENDFKRFEASRSQPRLKELAKKLEGMGERSKKLSSKPDVD